MGGSTARRTRPRPKRWRSLAVGAAAVAVTTVSACIPPVDPTPPDDSTTTTTTTLPPPVPDHQLSWPGFTLDLRQRTVAACADGIDNDGDGMVDYPADHGCTDAGDDSEWRESVFVPRLENLALTGRYGTDGELTFPAGSFFFPKVIFGAADPYSPALYQRIEVVGSPTGSVDLATGEVAFDLRIRIRIYTVDTLLTVPEHAFPASCYIGGSGGFDVRLTSETTDPPAPASPVQGTRFSGPGSTVTLVANDFAVPTVSGCANLMQDFAPAFNELLDLPAVAGEAVASFGMQLLPA